MNRLRLSCRARQGRAQDALYLGALLILVVCWMGSAWTEPDAMWYTPGAAFSDLTITHWPNWYLVREGIRAHGQIPLWQPAILGGTPHVGNPLSALFYPPNWLALLLPLARSFDLQYALHAFGAGAALYALARWSYGRSPFAAFLGGLSYALTPKWFAHMGAGHVGFCQAYAWLPLVVWSLRACLNASIRSRDLEIADHGYALGKGAIWKSRLQARQATERGTGSCRRETVATSLIEQRLPFCAVLACAAALAMTYLADPRVASYALGVAALYSLHRLIGVWRQAGWRPTLSLAFTLLLIPLVFLLFAAVQMLPTAALMPLTTRASITLKEAGYDSLPWRYLIGYGIADRGGYHEWMTYLGLLPLALGLLALWKEPDRERWFWAGLALMALLYALGINGPLFPLLYRLLPALGWVRVPSRALILVVLSANLMAVWGVDALLTGKGSAQARRWATRLALAGVLTCVGLGIGFAALYGRETPPAAYALAWIGAAACGVWLLAQQPRVPRLAVQAALLVLLIVDLWPVGHSLIERRPAEQIFGEKAAVAAYLAEKTSPSAPVRVYSPSYSVPQHVGARSGLEQLDGVDPLQLSWAAGFIGLAGGAPAQGYSVTQPPFLHQADPRTLRQNGTPDAALLGAFNVCTVVAEYPIQAPGLALEAQVKDTYIYTNQRCLPRAYLATHVDRVEDWNQAHSILRQEFDPTSGTLVEGGKALNGPAGTQAAIVREHTPNRVVVSASTTQDALLVLAEVWSPGWWVTVDGVARPCYRVNGIARGVYVEPGEHTVVWTYRPPALRWGAALTAGTLLLWIVGVSALGEFSAPGGFVTRQAVPDSKSGASKPVSPTSSDQTEAP